MKSEQFCFWLQGYFELSKNQGMTPEQVQIIRNHLNLVFKHEIDPSMPDKTGEFQKIHDGINDLTDEQKQAIKDYEESAKHLEQHTNGLRPPYDTNAFLRC